MLRLSLQVFEELPVGEFLVPDIGRGGDFPFSQGFGKSLEAHGPLLLLRGVEVVPVLVDRTHDFRGRNFIDLLGTSRWRWLADSSLFSPAAPLFRRDEKEGKEANETEEEPQAKPEIGIAPLSLRDHRDEESEENFKCNCHEVLSQFYRRRVDFSTETWHSPTVTFKKGGDMDPLKNLDSREIELPETIYIRDIETRVFQGIVLRALAKVEGIALLEGNLIDSLLGREIGNTKGITVEQDQKRQSVHVRIEIHVAYGISIPEKAEEIQSKVVEEISTWTGLHVASVHVVFKDLLLAASEEGEEEKKVEELEESF